MNGSKLAANPLFRGLIMGYPGSGKTGCLAALANAGYKVRLLDLDGNPESLLQYTLPEFLPNIDIVNLEDKIVDKGAYAGPEGMPMAYTKALRMLDRWRYEDPDGTELDAKTGKRYTDLGRSSDWGPDTVVVVDGVTGLSDAALWRARAATGKTPMNMTQAVWGAAANDVLNFTRRFTASTNKHHSIMISHVKIVGPKVEQATDSELAKTVKAESAELIPTKLQPTAVGWQLPQYFCGEFPITLVCEQVAKGKTVYRRIKFEPRPDMDLKLPVKDPESLKDLSLRDGLLRIFQALGSQPPGAATAKLVA